VSGEPIVSVVVPTFNRADLLGETLQSILAQSLRELELIVVSDGSTDNTREVVEGLGDARVKFIAQANSGGPAGPRNTGVRAARGKYVAFCDDDDLWMTDKLAKQVALLERRPELALCYTEGENFGDLDLFTRNTMGGRMESGHARALLYRNFITNSSVVVRRSVLAQVGEFNEARELRGTEDYEMWLRIAHRHPIAGVHEPLFRYRIHRANLAGNRSRATRRSMKVLRDLRNSRVIGSPIALPLLWTRIKWLVYTVAKR
jgi:glycosyltransferase involved in cell wall biosynthesis